MWKVAAHFVYSLFRIGWTMLAETYAHVLPACKILALRVRCSASLAFRLRLDKQGDQGHLKARSAGGDGYPTPNEGHTARQLLLSKRLCCRAVYCVFKREIRRCRGHRMDAWPFSRSADR